MIFRKLEELKPHPQNDYYFDDTEEAAFKLLKDHTGKFVIQF